MKISIESPSKALIAEYTTEELSSLRKVLTYTNTSIKHLIKRHYGNRFWRDRNSDTWQSRLEELQKDLHTCLVFQEEDRVYIRPGSIPYLPAYDLQVENKIQYPKFRPIPWKKPLPFILHPYQDDSWIGLSQVSPSNVSLTTGSGKSAIILKKCKESGLPTCIVVPSKSVFYELLEKFEFHFGKKYVGTFGDGKKKIGKRFTIAIGDSLANIEPGSEEWEFFSKLDCLIVDESHEFAAESLEKVCHGVLADIPHRSFLSATQIRNDGSGPLLQSIIGKTVCELTTAEAVKKGYICYHDFVIVSMDSNCPDYPSNDPLELKRVHFLNNTNIASFIAKLSNAMAAKGKGTLILVQELSQISMLIPLLKFPFVIAHSEKKKERLEELGFEKVDNEKSVESFNKGEAKIFIGTNCIATGTNIFPCHNVVNWVGGSSPIRTKQGPVGRAVRFGRSNPWATKCTPKDSATIYDFDIDNSHMKRQLGTRVECYNESGTEIRYIRIKAA